MRIPHRGDGGFSLVEVLVATAILTSALVALAQLLVIGAQATMAARDTTYATALARDKLEQLRSGPFPAPVTHASEEVAPRYHRRWSVEPLAAQPAESVVLTVEVYGRNPAAPRLVQVRTIRTRTGRGAGE